MLTRCESDRSESRPLINEIFNQVSEKGGSELNNAMHVSDSAVKPAQPRRFRVPSIREASPMMRLTVSGGSAASSVTQKIDNVACLACLPLMLLVLHVTGMIIDTNIDWRLTLDLSVIVQLR